jgi:hypothetical protein
VLFRSCLSRKPYIFGSDVYCRERRGRSMRHSLPGTLSFSQSLAGRRCRTPVWVGRWSRDAAPGRLGIDKPHGLELLWGEGPRYGITAIV